ncbi:hypothetical protein SKAU_G00148530 [Synaphobranchus kaupii]|uniref:PAS domain-containing protein n=1 Tax=Synaphobranchus kaupii TaxID=118154 RepID=A0A9Q1FTR7_SYNKA|nr:hypothetical protein SKAU_G00148530 [Synaphobranchus kaupii]
MSGKRGSSPCSPPRATDVSVNRRKVSCKRFRSTKGASKARRDQINAEIRNMRCLLPISQEDQERLSYLHSMSAICTYVRKSVFFQGLRPEEGGSSSMVYEGLVQALPGFIVALSSEGKLIYVSENVDEYLGFSMVDLLQGDSFYAMVERKELNKVKSHIEEACAAAGAEKAFVCRMHTSKSFRVRQGGSCTVLVRGRFQSIPQSSAACPDMDRAFVGLCTPTVNRLKDGDLQNLSQNFRTVHQHNMTFIHACESAPFYLGYSSEDMIGQSWYNLLHPEDLALGAEAHKILLQVNEGTPVEMVLRLQCVDLSWKWLYIRAAKDSGKQTVTCTNYIISETEAEFLVQKIYTDLHGPSKCGHLQKSSQRPTPPHIQPCQSNGAIAGLKRQRLPSSPSEQPQIKTSRLTEPEVSGTIPINQACGGCSSLADHQAVMSPTSSHSPAPSHSPAAQEVEAESDFLLDICDYDYAEDLLSLQEGLPSCISFQGSHCGPSGPLPPSGPLQPIVRHGFPLSDIDEASARSPEASPSPSSPSYDFSSCSADARLVPDCLPTPATYEGLLDCALHPEALRHPTDSPGNAGSYFTPLPDHGASLTSDPSPSPSPTPTPGVNSVSALPYSEREQEEISILARQISSLASSFDMYRSADQAQSLGRGYEQASPDCSRCSSVSDPPAQETGTADPVFSWSHATPHPVKPELVLDEGIIDNILKDLDRVPGVDSLSRSSLISRCGPVVTLCPRSGQQAPGAAAAIHSDVLSFAALVEDLSHEQPPGGATVLDAHILTARLQENIELNQFNHFLHKDLQQDYSMASKKKQVVLKRKSTGKSPGGKCKKLEVAEPVSSDEDSELERNFTLFSKQGSSKSAGQEHESDPGDDDSDQSSAEEARGPEYVSIQGDAESSDGEAESDSASEDSEDDASEEEATQSGVRNDGTGQSEGDIKRELSTMSFEDIMKLQNKVGRKAYNEVAYGAKNKQVHEKKKRLNKNRPMEMSAKRPAPFLRQVVPVKKPVLRDPRFDDLSGEYKPEIFEKTYSFIHDIKQKEKEIVQKKLRKVKKPKRREQMQQLLKRMVNQQEAHKRQQLQREKQLELKRKQREMVGHGHSPYFLKKSDQRRLELAEKYRELKRGGKLENFLSKKRKRNAAKDRRKMPVQPAAE